MKIEDAGHDAGVADDVARQLGLAGELLSRALEALHHASAPGWTGEAADRAEARRHALETTTTHLGEASQRAQLALTAFAHDYRACLLRLGQARERLLASESALRTCPARAPDPSRGHPSTPPRWSPGGGSSPRRCPSVGSPRPSATRSPTAPLLRCATSPIPCART